jgi:hypothetical protein
VALSHVIFVTKWLASQQWVCVSKEMDTKTNFCKMKENIFRKLASISKKGYTVISLVRDEASEFIDRLFDVLSGQSYWAVRRR